MSRSGKAISIIVLSYLLFGLFNLFQHGYFLVPVTYNALVVFIIALAAFLPNLKQLKQVHVLFFTYSFAGCILHPFLWEIALSREQQFQLFDSLAFDVLRIIQWVVLIAFFLKTSYNRVENKLKIEWLIPAVFATGCLFNPPMWYICLLFIVSGLSAFYTLKRRTIGTDSLMDVLIGTGVIYLVSVFYD